MRVSEKTFNNFLLKKEIKFLLKIRKGFEAEQPFLLIFCSEKFVLFTSVCVVAKFFIFVYR